MYGYGLILLDLAGAVALLLWGVRMVQTGVQRAFGARLRAFLDRGLRNRLTAFLAGVGVTAILQSSTATGLMVTGFAADSLVGLVPALAVMLGANVGTTLIVQVLSFNVTAVAPILILIGVVMFRKMTAGPRDFGRVMIGLGLVLMALSQFVGMLAPYEHVSGLRTALLAITAYPLIDVAVAAIVTWAAHSSVAIVLVIMSFAARGTIPVEAALALVLGANLGTAINPLLEGAAGDDPAAKRLPAGNLLNRAIGVVIALPLLPLLTRAMEALEPDPSRAVADFHTLFNLVLAVAFFPILAPYATLMRRLLPVRVNQADPAVPQYLDTSAAETPFVALGGAAREALRLADVLGTMLAGLRKLIEKSDRRQLAETRALDDILDRLNTAIKSYVVALDPAAMTNADHKRAMEILHFATNMEQAGDVVDRNLLGIISKKIKRGLAFSPDGQAELLGAVDRLIGNVRTAASLFVRDDARLARKLAAEKQEFRNIEASATESHFQRLRAGRTDSAETSSLHLDMLSDLKRVNAHLVAAAAYPVLESKGELLASRLRQDDTEPDSSDPEPSREAQE
ncbi:MAG TPA: Na/Pi cotransporter family protein [Acidiphilium sp.]